MSDPNWLEKQWAETDPRPRGELLAALAEQATTIERLTGELTACIQKLADVRAANDDLEDRADSLSTELARVREALEPFLELAGIRGIADLKPDHKVLRGTGPYGDWLWLTAGDFARIRAAAGPAKSEGDAPAPAPEGESR